MDHPIRLVVTDDLRRNRLTVFFRLLLAVPHVVWLWLWSIVAVFALVAAWVAALVTGRVPDGLHRFLGGSSATRCTCSRTRRSSPTPSRPSPARPTTR